MQELSVTFSGVDMSGSSTHLPLRLSLVVYWYWTPSGTGNFFSARDAPAADEDNAEESSLPLLFEDWEGLTNLA